MDVTWLIFYVKVIIFVILIKDLFPFVELIISSLWECLCFSELYLHLSYCSDLCIIRLITAGKRLNGHVKPTIIAEKKRKSKVSSDKIKITMEVKNTPSR